MGTGVLSSLRSVHHYYTIVRNNPQNLSTIIDYNIHFHNIFEYYSPQIIVVLDIFPIFVAYKTMRKLLVMLLLMTPMLSFAQVKTIKIDDSYLKWAKEDGFELINGSTDYIVIDAPNFTQKELFNKMLLALNNYYIDIDKVVTKIEFDALTINATFIPNAPMSITDRPYIIANSRVFIFQSIDYRLSFKFKDGKIRIDTPYIKGGKAQEDVSDKKVLVEHSDLNFGAYHSMKEDFNSILVKLLKEAYQKDNDW